MGANKILSIEEKKEWRSMRDARSFASTNCVYYRECLSAAAKINKQLQCHVCDRMKVARDTFKREVNLANFSRSGAGEHSVKLGEISCPVNMTGEKKIMENQSKLDEKDKGEAAETRVCSQSNCEHGGKPQPIDEFKIHPRFGTRFKMCNSCLTKRKQIGQQRRHERRKEEKKKMDEHQGKDEYSTEKIKKNEKVEKNFLTIDFSKHTTVLEKIGQIAADELRTPEDQVLYWLKEFSIIANKEDAL